MARRAPRSATRLQWPWLASRSSSCSAGSSCGDCSRSGCSSSFFFFYAQYLVVWITNQLATETVRFAGIPVTIGNLTKFLERLNLNGTAHTFGNFVWFQGFVLVIVLALAGSVLVGNDFFHGSLPFYLVEADQPLALHSGQVPRDRRSS